MWFIFLIICSQYLGVEKEIYPKDGGLVCKFSFPNRPRRGIKKVVVILHDCRSIRLLSDKEVEVLQAIVLLLQVAAVLHCIVAAGSSMPAGSGSSVALYCCWLHGLWLKNILNYVLYKIEMHSIELVHLYHIWIQWRLK